MRKVIDISGYPLSPDLTRRVVNVLNVFRLFIALSLSVAYGLGILTQGQTFTNTSLAAAVLLVYVAVSIYFIVGARKPDESYYHLALQSLMADVWLIWLLLNTFEGLAVLLVFVGAVAGILLPLNLALLVAALATFALITLPGLAGLLGAPAPMGLLAAGLYGLTIMVITALTHLLATWARDFRLIAERQMRTVSHLEQINELVIRRLRSGVLALDRDGEIKMMNESAWHLLGNPPAGERELSRVSPELRIALQDWRQDPREEAYTVTLLGSQANVVPKFVALPEGLEIAVIVFLEDNDVVSKRAVELSAVSLAKLSSSIAHEIRNPLSAISHAAQLLEEDVGKETGGLDEGQARLVDIIRKQSRRMNGIVENILQLSRREQSQPELLDVVHWLHDLVEEFNTSQSGHDFTLALRGVPPDAQIVFDHSQLHQVLWKLMENALQHLGEAETDPELVLRASMEKETVFCVISVEDNGLGIPPEKIGDIFEPFFTTRSDGTGLGLYIARQLCEANQAELTVDSVPGKRTRFRIRMPLASASRASAQQEPLQEKA